MKNSSFKDLNDLMSQFQQQVLNFAGLDGFHVSDILYSLVPDQETYSFKDIIVKDKQPHLAYASDHYQIVFVWEIKNVSLHPRKVFMVERVHSETPSKPAQTTKKADGNGEEDEASSQSMKDALPSKQSERTGSAVVTPIEFHSPFYGVETQGKVDTGADICSIHGTNIEIITKSKQVSFDSEVLSDKRITMTYEDRQAVTTADGGVEYRPVVLLDVTIAGKKMSGIAFNINDRSNMTHKVLIGQNALEKGRFLVDPAAGTLIAKKGGA